MVTFSSDGRIITAYEGDKSPFLTMLRTRCLKYTTIHRSMHYSPFCSQQKATGPNIIPANQTNHFKDVEDLASIQEKAVFGKVFENMMRKDELRKKNSSDIIIDALSVEPLYNDGINTDDGKALQIVFEKKTQEIMPEDRKLFEFFKNTSGTGQLGDIGESAKLTTDDIRNYPVSLVSNIFSDSAGKTPTENNTASKKQLGTILTAANETAVARSDMDLRLNKKVLKNLEAKELFKAAMDKVMEAHLNTFFERIETDYDFFLEIRDLLQRYINRNKALDTGDQNSSVKIIEHIKKQCQSNSKDLPQPYRVTLPYTLVKLLTSKNFNFPSERKYSLASFIYQECKKSTDISLYLNVCNADFYNLLLQLSWENFHEIYQLKQLTTEMSINGISGDIHTVEILDRVVHDLRHINDGILDDDTGNLTGKPLTVGVVWCRENSMNLLLVENYLKKLKESLA